MNDALRLAFVPVAAALVLAAACAPPPARVVQVTDGARGPRYLSQLLLREQRAVMVEGVATIWPGARAARDSCQLRRLPAVQAGLVVAWPDAFRLRVVSVFGTAVDLGVEGDSLVAYAPAQRWGVALDAASDSLGVRDPGRLAVRLVSAAWRPPDSAWALGTREGDLLVLRWRESGDFVAVAMNEAGSPVWVDVGWGGGRGLRVQYERWESVEGVAWPVVWRARERGGAFELATRVERVRFGERRDPQRFVVGIPEDAERLGLGPLRRLLDHWGGGP